jgi:hypothetical protein
VAEDLQVQAAAVLNLMLLHHVLATQEEMAEQEAPALLAQ